MPTASLPTASLSPAGRTSPDLGLPVGTFESGPELLPSSAALQRHGTTTALLGTARPPAGRLTAAFATSPRGASHLTRPSPPGAPRLPSRGTPSSTPAPRTPTASLARSLSAATTEHPGSALLAPTRPPVQSPSDPAPDTGPPLTVVAQRARGFLGNHRPLPPVPQRPATSLPQRPATPLPQEPPPPDDPPSAPTAASAGPVPPTEPAPSATPAKLSPPELDTLAQQLLDPMMRRIRNELLLDRERRGRRGDWR
ncbi:hypothetical protein [Ruania zhangjianzhongii]|uniref:hypothetical protein n=1 Tax=Ruania zhangjianzhongii TaxID=2603206 RepID=UPI0011CA2C84|nr:hypothetical protein [Ruania zhangjianzhongii]